MCIRDSLTEVLRRPFSRSLDPYLIGRDESARWLAGAERMMEAGDDAGLPEPICHVHHMLSLIHIYRRRNGGKRTSPILRRRPNS